MKLCEALNRWLQVGLVKQGIGKLGRSIFPLGLVLCLLISLCAPLFFIQPALADTPPAVEWTKVFGGGSTEWGYTVQQSGDGGYVVAGGTYSFGAGDADAYLIKTDSQGNEIWSRTYGGPGADGAGNAFYQGGDHVQQTTDGGYIIVGLTLNPLGPFTPGGFDLYLIKTDSNGNEIWSKTFGGGGEDEGLSVVQTKDGGYIVSGFTASFGAGGYDVYLIKTDANGNEQWSKTFGTVRHEWGSVRQTADGGYIIVGVTADPVNYADGDVLLIKTDASGNQQWSKTYGGSSRDQGHYIQQTSDGGYIIAAGTCSYGAGNWDGYLIKTDANGNELWSRTFGGEVGDNLTSVEQTSDGGYIVSGETYSSGVGQADAWVIKTDPCGNMVWQETFGGPLYDRAESIHQTADGGYIFAGLIGGISLGDIYLVKLGPETPNAPSNLSATAISSSEIDLSWQDNSDSELGFKIERKTGAGGTYSQIAVLGADVTTYSDTGLIESATYYYRVKAYNSFGDSSYSNEASATTNNVPPVAEAGADQTVNEGDIVGFSGSFTGSETDTFTIAWDFGDGATATDTLTPTHVYSDNGVYAVTLTVADDDGGIGTDTLTVTVNNVTPMVDAGPDAIINEGETFSSSGFFTDPGDDLWFCYVDYGDGAGIEPLIFNADKTFALSHTYTDNGSYFVTVIVDDDDGDRGTDVVSASVNNVAPTVDAGADQTVSEGDTVNFSGFFSDPGADSYIIEWDFGDGAMAKDTLIPTHVYSDNGAYVVTLTVTDDDGGVTTDALAVAVNNVAPVVEAGPDAVIDEGGTFSGTGFFTDPGDDLWFCYVDYGDGAGIQPLIFYPDKTFVFSHTYLDDGEYLVTAIIDDDDSGRGTDTLTVAVNNVAPAVEAGNDQTANEGDTVYFSGSFTDQGWLDTHSIEWDFGDGSTATGTLATSHVYGDNGNYTVTLTVTDDDGGIGTDTLIAAINNVAPLVGEILAPIDPVRVNTVINTSAPFSDLGFLDTHTAVWDWGDGSASGGIVSEANGSGTVSGSHAYTVPGVYTVTLTVTDDDGGSARSVFRYVVVYDPIAGFVTGGGWINSPAGAYTPDASLAGKATFGFVSRYEKGATIPSGQTRFQFHVADLNFGGTSYQWLVIAGARAQYKGSGTINSSGDYGFILTAIDEKLTSSTDVDLFRIKIWDKVTDNIIYDNQMGAADTDYPTTAIGGGSIVIHTK